MKEGMYLTGEKIKPCLAASQQLSSRAGEPEHMSSNDTWSDFFT